MKEIQARFTALLLAACLAGAAPLPVFAAQSKDPESTRKELDAVVEQLNALDKWMNDAEKQRVRWEKEVQQKDTEVATVAGRVETAGAAVRAVEAELGKLSREQQALEGKRAEQAGRIGQHLAASYRMSGQDFLKLMLNQESPDTFERIARYHRYFTEARMAVLDDYRTTLDELADNRLQLETQRDEANHRRETLEQQEQALVRERESRRKLLADLGQQIEDKSGERKRLEADRARLEQLFAELTRRTTELDGTAFEARKGALPWPVSGRVVNAFGQPRADGRLTWHGMLIAADEGTSVRSVFRGRVVFASWLRGFGLLTIVDHGGGYMTLYGHADVLLKTVGDWAESGEVIARAGKSGGQQRSGLYFEVRQKGVARDPIGWLQRR
ncbi:MAG TPA: peptidoglycan DD-metalloendopeptidase family protein [Pseudomonadales bacterium]